MSRKEKGPVSKDAGPFAEPLSGPMELKGPMLVRMGQDKGGKTLIVVPIVDDSTRTSQLRDLVIIDPQGLFDPFKTDGTQNDVMLSTTYGAISGRDAAIQGVLNVHAMAHRKDGTWVLQGVDGTTGTFVAPIEKCTFGDKNEVSANGWKAVDFNDTPVVEVKVGDIKLQIAKENDGIHQKYSGNTLLPTGKPTRIGSEIYLDADDLVIDDFSVSRTHATIIPAGDYLFVTDTYSKNGTSIELASPERISHGGELDWFYKRK